MKPKKFNISESNMLSWYRKKIPTVKNTKTPRGKWNDTVTLMFKGRFVSEGENEP